MAASGERSWIDEPRRLADPPRAPRVLAPYLDAAERWLAELRANLDLPPSEESRALRALRAGLHAIRDRLPAAEVVDLGAQLPALIRGLYYDGWKMAEHAPPIRTREAMIARVAEELAPDQHLAPVDVLRAVLHLLVEHVSDGEIHDLLAVLPAPLAALWHDLTGHALQER